MARRGERDIAIAQGLGSVISFRNKIGEAVFGIQNIVAILDDYSRVGDFLIRTGRVPQTTQLGAISSALEVADILAGGKPESVEAVVPLSVNVCPEPAVVTLPM